METVPTQRRPRRSFSKEFKRDAVNLVRSSGKTIPEVGGRVELALNRTGTDAGQCDRGT